MRAISRIRVRPVGEYRNTTGSPIKGSLVFNRLLFSDEADLCNTLNGEVEYNKKTASGPGAPGQPTGKIYRDAIAVAVGPEVIFKRIRRY